MKTPSASERKPIAAELDSSFSGPGGAEIRSRAPKILLVDDSGDQRKIVRHLLERSGYSVIEAADGREGLSRAISETPDAVLLDFDMPNMNGYELLQELRAD